MTIVQTSPSDVTMGRRKPEKLGLGSLGGGFIWMCLDVEMCTVGIHM